MQRFDRNEHQAHTKHNSCAWRRPSSLYTTHAHTPMFNTRPLLDTRTTSTSFVNNFLSRDCTKALPHSTLEMKSQLLLLLSCIRCMRFLYPRRVEFRIKTSSTFLLYTSIFLVSCWLRFFWCVLTCVHLCVFAWTKFMRLVSSSSGRSDDDDSFAGRKSYYFSFRMTEATKWKKKFEVCMTLARE